MDYQEWNDLLAAHFFRAEMAGRKVFVYVTAELLDQLGTAHAVDHSDFVRAVLAGPTWAVGYGLCQRAMESFRDWRKRGLSLPPYLAYLGLFTQAAGLEGEFAPHAYYPRLRTLIGERPIIGEYSHFSYMHLLWEDLEKWSLEDQRGSLGIFNVILASKMRHVGIPMAQTLMSEAELGTLPAVFARAGLDPTSPPSGENLASSVRAVGGHHLRPRTLLLLSSDASHPELREALVQIIADELQAWDGTAPVEEAAAEYATTISGSGPATPESPRGRELVSAAVDSRSISVRTGRIFGALRLTCHLDRVAGRARVGLMCRSVHAMPEEGLVLHGLGDGGSFACDELAAGWSTPLRVTTNGRDLDASTLDWSAGVELADEDGTWHLRLPPGPVRVFTNAQGLGIPGLIEVGQMPPAAPFYVAARSDCALRIARWGGESCSGFREFPSLSGLPGGWRLFYAERANGDELVRQSFPILALPQSVSLQLDGGLRAAGLNEFFDFAPPSVVVSGVTGDWQVVCNGAPLVAAAQGHYLLPPDLPKDSRAIIEVLQAGEMIARKNVWLVGPHPWPLPGPEHRFDARSSPTSPTARPIYAGGLTEGVACPDFRRLWT